MATTDPVTLPVTSTIYLIPNLPHPDHATGHWSGLLPAASEEIVWWYGLRMWLEASYKHVKHGLGWSAYQVRSDRAIRRQWQWVWCAFAFSWHHQHDAAQAVAPAAGASSHTAEQEEKKPGKSAVRPQVCWPQALRAVRGWLEPWVLLHRYWGAWSKAPPPPTLQHLLDWLGKGNVLSLYEPP